ncbi:hypothetical protein AgCh_031842 [Apium graveolens]
MEASNIKTRRRKRWSGVLSSSSSGVVLHLHNVRLLLIHIILCQTTSCMAAAASGTLNYTKYRQVGSLRLARIQKHLDGINKTPVLTIQSPDGDIIDCIPKRKQPALDHPLLKNHKIQRVRPEMPKRKKESVNVTTRSRDEEEERVRLKGVWQAWHENKERCPRGSVPIRRSHVHDVLRANSLYDFGKKRHAFPAGSRLPMAGRHPDAPDVVSANGHEHAIAYTGASQEVYGARATINVWDPSIEVVNEFSLSQIWVLSGSFDGSDLNSIEAGWQVPSSSCRYVPPFLLMRLLLLVYSHHYFNLTMHTPISSLF